MQIDTHMVRGEAVRTHVVTGVIHIQEFIKLLKVIYRSEDYDPQMHSLWDVTTADLSQVTPQEIRGLAEMVKSQWEAKGRHRAAIVVAGLSDFGISRMYEQVLGPAAAGYVKIFRNRKTAHDWLEECVATEAKWPVKQTVPDSNPPR